MHVRALGLPLLAVVAAACPAPAPLAPGAGAAVEDVPIAAAPTGRLPDTVVPKGYRLSLDLEPGRGSFRGTVEIDIELRAAASSVWLNAKELRIESATLHRGPTSLPLTSLEAPAESGLLGFAFGKTLAPGTARLEIQFAGSPHSAEGIFHQRFGGAWYTYTDFEPIDARRGIPCFDDPRFKTPWTVSLTVPRHLRAFSNTPVESRKDSGSDRKTVRFATTPPLPSYLVAFAVGPFEVVGERRGEATPVRIITFPGRSSHATRALTAARALLPMATAWVDMPVPFRKLDFIAVPLFDGAMENPGLITVSERILHLDPDDPDPTGERLMTLVVAHEIAHLWFGDLVTMDWWDDLWLNEGFATYLADELIEAWKPEWHWHLEREAMRSRAYEADTRGEVRAVRQPVTTDAEIRASFDVITYIKGGAILEMLDHWLGRKQFQAGVRAYLREHAGKTATTDDLIDALGRASGARPVHRVVRSFVTQKGVPIFDTELPCDEVDTAKVIEHSVAADAGDASGTKRTWTMPACTEVGYRLRPAAGSEDRSSIQTLQWARARLRSADPELNRMARSMLESGPSRALHGPAAEQLVEALVELEHVMPATPALSGRIRPTIEAIGWRRKAGERVDDREARPALIELAARHIAVPAAVRTRADAWLRDRTGLDDELAAATLAAIAVRGDKALHRRMLAQLRGETRHRHRDAIVAGLASFGDPQLLRASLAETLSPGTPRFDAIKLLYKALENPHTRSVAFEFLARNIEALGTQMRLSPVMSRFACTASQVGVAQALLANVHARTREQERVLEQVRHEYQTCKRLRDHYTRGSQGAATEARDVVR